MKTFGVAVVLLGLLAANSAFAQNICAGAEGQSKACAPACSNQIVNDDVNGTPNAGKFNVGGGNQGDGNDGFNNVGSFNIGSSNKGNCAITSGSTGGTCDPGNNAGQIVLRFCKVLPSNPTCQPSGYLPEFSQALRDQLPAVVASCSGVVVQTPTPTTASSPPPPTATTTPAATPAATTTPIAAAAALVAQGPSAVPAAVQPNALTVSDSTADLATLLALFDEHIQQEKASGRKLKL
jgi:hypothetical protein